LPFLLKEHVRQNFPGKLLNEKYELDKCFISGTTGSTGKSVNFAYSKSTFLFYLCTSLRVYTMIGYKPWYKMAFIKYTPIPTIKIPGLPLFKTYHIPSIAPIDKQMELLRQYNPDLLAGYASIIYEMACSLTENDKKNLKIKIISLNSELSTIAERDFISKAFNCPVYDEYSTEETWMVASQCKYKNYHIFTDNVYVEFLDDDGKNVKEGEIGEVILTTLRSPAMPFIRYKIGDIGSYSLEKCPCGRNFPLLKSFEGRADDVFILPNGKKVSSLKLLNTFTKFIKSDPKLMNEFKFVQEKVDSAVIYLIPGEEFAEERFKELINQLDNILEKTIYIELKIVDSIDNQGKIKRKAIESLVSRRNK
jgi:phenylacetate-CoA ligase